MSTSLSSHVSALVCLTATALLFTGCATPNATPLSAPSLSFNARSVCTPTPSFDAPIKRVEDEKIRKRENRRQMISLVKNMANSDVPCLTTANGEGTPYMAFAIPKGIEKRVVNAGSLYDEAVIFAAIVTTHDENGGLIRTFQDADYRRLGPVYGVQFSPRPTEHFVLIQADPSLIGGREETVETTTRSQYVSTYGANGYGGGGTNLRGIQRSFVRTYSYNGSAVVQTVFPKQKFEK